MSAVEAACAELRARPRRWLITGVAGFIGSHLLEKLLSLGQRVAGLDNFATGSPAHLEEVLRATGGDFHFCEGSVTDLAACRAAVQGVDFVLHQAGFVSVPRSLEDPAGCHESNVTGTRHLLQAAEEARVRRFVYASTSAVYGDVATVPNVEEEIGRALSPYGASRQLAEQYAGRSPLETAGLRYFNVFGPRQDAAGGYAAVIPLWLATLARGEICHIHGDGEQTRDFCPVANVVQANLLAATAPVLPHRLYNVALGGSTSINELHRLLGGRRAIHEPARAGDIRHSAASIARIRQDLGYAPEVSVAEGLAELLREQKSASV